MIYVKKSFSQKTINDVAIEGLSVGERRELVEASYWIRVILPMYFFGGSGKPKNKALESDYLSQSWVYLLLTLRLGPILSCSLFRFPNK